MPLNILHITPWFPNHHDEGPLSFIYHAVAALGQIGHKVPVLVTRPWTPGIFGLLRKEWVRPSLDPKAFPDLPEVKQINYLSVPRDLCRSLAGPLFRLGTDKMILAFIKKYHIDLIHAHTEDVGYGAVRLGKTLDIPVVVTLHGINTSPRRLNTRGKRDVLRKTLDKADRVILVGESLRQYFESLAGRTDHFCVVPNGFLLPKEMEYSYNKEWRKGLRIVSISNLHEGKGIDLNLEALAMLEAKGFKDWEYQIVGEGYEKKRLEKMAASLGLMDKIHFQGVLSGHKKWEILNACNVFLLPSYREAFGIAYLEAMGAGLLSIGVIGQGPEAFIQDNVTGYLVLPRDADSIFRKLSYVYEHQTEAKRIAEAGQLQAWGNFTWENHATKLMQVYQEALEARS